MSEQEGRLINHLREELVRIGCTKQQANSKVVMAVLEVLTKSKKYLDLQIVEDERDREETQLCRLKAERESLELEVKDLRIVDSDLRKHLGEKMKAFCDDTISYIDRFLSDLEKCETPEARDVMRVAQTYVNTVSIDTKYDNTAFIIGLASILSQGKTAPINELRKINRKIPTPPDFVMPDGEGYDLPFGFEGPFFSKKMKPI